MRASSLALALLAIAIAPGCGPSGTGEPPGPDEHGSTPASEATAEANARFAESFPVEGNEDFEEARRGLVASDPEMSVRTPDGGSFSQSVFAFVEGDSPKSVNPSLWRQAKLNGNHGLFQVADGIYQVRGYDVSNMSWIRGRTGWIVVDPLTSVESAEAAAALARKHLDPAPVVAVIFTHSHIDHFGGVRAVLPNGSPEGVRIIAPRRFVEEVASENVLAGVAMGRRAIYQFGNDLPIGPRGYVDSGLGKQPRAYTTSFATPTDLIDRTPQEMSIDGVPFVFQYAPESEAPAELTFYLPEQKAYCGAEIVSRTMHNLYTLRGAKVRDALRWSGYIDDALRLFPDVEIVFTSHHWPTFGSARSIDFLKGQRDTYRFLHDQTLRLANQGATPREIAEQLELPPSLARHAANRGYYGSVRHNAKAVYQFYFGWYDGNPANLDPLPPVDLGTKWIDAVGGSDAAKQKARAAMDAGEYRWAATLLDHLVFTDPDDDEARELLATTYDQLGYQAENGVWRSVYLTGASELRHGVPERGDLVKRFAGELLAQIPLDLFFAAMAARIDGAKAAAGEPRSFNFVFTDVGETHVLELENGVLHHRRGDPMPNADATVRVTRALFQKLGTGEAGIRDLVFSDELEVEGSRMALLSFFGLLDPVDEGFAIVTP